jgi:hypothetical protein
LSLARSLTGLQWPAAGKPRECARGNLGEGRTRAAQGLPWVFDRFTLVGTFEDFDDNGALKGLTTVNSARRGELPLQQTLFVFP